VARSSPPAAGFWLDTIVLRGAVADRVIPVDPSEGVTLPRRRRREAAIRPPKYGSERVVHLPEPLVTMLSEHVATYRPDGKPGRWLLPDLGGRPLHNNAVTYRWRQTRKAAGIPSIRLHDYCGTSTPRVSSLPGAMS